MRKKLTLLVLVVSAVMLSGCSLVAKPANIQTDSPVESITGKVSLAGGKFTITSGAKMTEITSRKIDLKLYDGKVVTVVGEFSGTTLYVDEVK